MILGRLMRIEWPSGTVQELENVASKQFLTITEPGGEPRLAATLENGRVQRDADRQARFSLRDRDFECLDQLDQRQPQGHSYKTGAVSFPAPGATNDPQRFYRAVWQ